MIARDDTGQIIIPGTRRVSRRWMAADGGVPDFLTLGESGSDAGASFTVSEGIAPYAQLNPAVSASSLASLYGPSIDLNDVEFMRLTLIGLRFSDRTGVGLRLGAWDIGVATVGGRLDVPPGTNNGADAPYATLRTFPINSFSNPHPGDTPYVARNANEHRKIRDLGFIMYPKTRYQFLMEGDQAAVAWKHPRLDRGEVTPAVQVVMPSSGTIQPRHIRFDGIKMELGLV